MEGDRQPEQQESSTEPEAKYNATTVETLSAKFPGLVRPWLLNTQQEKSAEREEENVSSPATNRIHPFLSFVVSCISCDLLMLFFIYSAKSTYAQIDDGRVDPSLSHIGRTFKVRWTTTRLNASWKWLDRSKASLRYVGLLSTMEYLQRSRNICVYM